MQGGASENTYGVAAWAVTVSLAISVVLGLPIYLFLSRKRIVNLLSLSVGGAIISMLPWALLSYPGITTKSIVGQTIVIENGSYTTEGIVFQIQFIAQFGLCGAISGFIFWLIVKSLITTGSSTTRNKTRASYP
ncbi:hypothetical protein MNBD_GAMMA15-1280 [hydrothermal vent metagenome]|uniref:Uncharacterized protein n=1 Tax=hydrothermal vent metagenome TaxID=652676 RepID=A0A3B0YF95_9ZZZZ